MARIQFLNSITFHKDYASDFNFMQTIYLIKYLIITQQNLEYLN